jgi:hypothetical protein
METVVNSTPHPGAHVAKRIISCYLAGERVLAEEMNSHAAALFPPQAL